jgi:hypothetical protein
MANGDPYSDSGTMGGDWSNIWPAAATGLAGLALGGAQRGTLAAAGFTGALNALNNQQLEYGKLNADIAYRNQAADREQQRINIERANQEAQEQRWASYDKHMSAEADYLSQHSEQLKQQIEEANRSRAAQDEFAQKNLKPDQQAAFLALGDAQSRRDYMKEWGKQQEEIAAQPGIQETFKQYGIPAASWMNREQASRFLERVAMEREISRRERGSERPFLFTPNPDHAYLVSPGGTAKEILDSQGNPIGGRSGKPFDEAAFRSKIFQENLNNAKLHPELMLDPMAETTNYLNSPIGRLDLQHLRDPRSMPDEKYYPQADALLQSAAEKESQINQQTDQRMFEAYKQANIRSPLSPYRTPTDAEMYSDFQKYKMQHPEEVKQYRQAVQSGAFEAEEQRQAAQATKYKTLTEREQQLRTQGYVSPRAGNRPAADIPVTAGGPMRTPNRTPEQQQEIDAAKKRLGITP